MKTVFLRVLEADDKAASLLRLVGQSVPDSGRKRSRWTHHGFPLCPAPHSPTG